MHEIALDLLILLAGIWLVAVTLRPLGLPTVMGELIVGVVVGPAVLGLIEPGEAVKLLAEIGIFFLMFHAGLETQPLEFYEALKRSMGVAVVGAIVPFSVSFLVASAFGLSLVAATFVGLTMTATAVVITLKCLKDLGLDNTRVARVVIASCVIDDLLTLIFFGLIIGVLTGGSFEPIAIAITLGKVVAFFGVALLLGRFVYPKLSLPFRSEGGKGFTFILMIAFAAGLFAEAIGLHMILGAYLAGLFFEEKVAHPNLVRVVADRAYGIAYSFLGPIFFISLGFSVTFDISTSDVGFLAILTLAVIVGQIVSAGSMALRMGLPPREALTVGVGMCGRAELAFILAALALSEGAFDQSVFSVLIFTAFLLNLFTPLALKGCAVLLEGKAVPLAGATRGILQIDKFKESLIGERSDELMLPKALPDVTDVVVVYGYGPEVESLLSELESRSLPSLVIEEDEAVARQLHKRGQPVVNARPAEELMDLAPLATARALVANGDDEQDALLANAARERGFTGPIAAVIDDPERREFMLLAGATAAFTPSHVLAAALAAQASAKINPRVVGLQLLKPRLVAAELRVHEGSPLANRTLAEVGFRARTGWYIVGQWPRNQTRCPPAVDKPVRPNTVLLAIGNPETIQQLPEFARPITEEGTIVVLGRGEVGQKVVKLLTDASENTCVVAPTGDHVADVVGEVIDSELLERASVAAARVVIITLESDDSAVFAATMVRKHAPDVPVIASAIHANNVERIKHAGADFVLSLSEVAGQLLNHHVLGEPMQLQSRAQLVKIDSSQFIGRHPFKVKIRERTGCSVVAVQRGEKIITDFPASFTLKQGDGLYICGSNKGILSFHEEFPSATSSAWQ